GGSRKLGGEGSSGGERPGGRVDVPALPELEQAEAPEAVAVVGAAVHVLAEQPLELGAAEEAAVRAREEEVGGEGSQLPAEPAVERHAEAGLAARGDPGRQVVGERLPQRPLAAREPGREREPELDQAVVEEGR